MTEETTIGEARLSALFAANPLPGAPDALMARLGLVEPVLAAAPVPLRRPSRWRPLASGLVAAAVMVGVGLSLPRASTETIAASPTPAVQEASAHTDSLLSWFGPEGVEPVDPFSGN